MASAAFNDIVEKCKKNGKKFEDPEFLRADSSIYLNTTRPPKMWPKVTEWKRVTEFVKNPKMFVSGIEPGDVIQGVLGDCWFLGAVSVVATRPALLDKVFTQKDLNEYGVYEFNFYKDGEWVSVIIDDFIPLNRGRPIFSRCKDMSEVWVMLLEKAYAKLHRCYENLEGGAESYALVDLTGGAPEVQELDSADGKKDVTSGKIWERLNKYIALGYLTGCAMITEGVAEKKNGKGILQNHAYGILGVKEINGNKLIRIRNPWGEGEWKGKWSDGSSNWTQEMLDALNYSFADDGTFWMDYSDFTHQFNRFYILRLFNKDWTSHRIGGGWKGASAGGCGNYATWKNNPQILFHLPEPSDVFITLMQTDKRMQGTRDSDINIGFLLLKTSDPSRKIVQIRGPEVIGQTLFNANREVSKKFLLPEGHYVIAPSTFYPNKNTGFIIRVYSQSKNAITLSEISVSEEKPIRPVTGPTAKIGSSETLRNGKTSRFPTLANNNNDGNLNNTTSTRRSYASFVAAPHPLYATSSAIIGAKEPNEHDLPYVWHGLKSTKLVPVTKANSMRD